jgi:ferredoxin
MLEGTWTVEVDRARCMGSGTCLVYAAGTFDLDTGGKAAVHDPITDDLDAVRNAADACPTQAITVVEPS